MEINVVSTEGIPQTGVISIRAGNTRRQVQIKEGFGAPLKFASLEENATIKVEVLDLRGTSRIAYNSAQSQYNVTVEPEEAFQSQGQSEVVLSVRKDANGSGVDFEEANIRKEAAAQNYMENHGLVTYIQFLVQSLMKDKPPDPISYLQKHLSARAAGRPPPVFAQAFDASPAQESPSDTDLETLLAKLSKADEELSPELLDELQRDAAAAVERLRVDNMGLRENATDLAAQFKNLLQESEALRQQAADQAAKAAGKPVAKDSTGGREPPPALRSTWNGGKLTYRDILDLQNDITALAKENSQLVNQLGQLRSSYDTVRVEMDEMAQNMKA
eukprot:gnl/TRDRNA2_/TRDRNA2_178665_c0_seq1.p1 gnl/TRDRNA2_/TRDRNA2_178665_c0~~gnl/TRDRNA2_/TRDRNA2_178665_c0_seq1.p1  ORF type:complete len:342 (-),score=88.19 gnl/TRDRNA2_/TRDRNA2_178665_c0_seq1:249-1241(-)